MCISKRNWFNIFETTWYKDLKFLHEKIDLGYDDLSASTKPEGRTYETPDGSYPSITTVIKILSEDSIAAWRKRVGEDVANKISYRASNRGTAVHNIIERYLKNEDLNLSTFPPHIVQSLKNLKPILDKRLSVIYALEAPLYSKHLGVAGRVDCVGVFDGVPSIIDFKTSAKKKKKEWIENYFIQESGYAIMWEERTGMPVPNLVTVMDVDNDDPLVFVEHRDNWTKKLLRTIELYKQRKFWDLTQKRGGM